MFFPEIKLTLPYPVVAKVVHVRTSCSDILLLSASAFECRSSNRVPSNKYPKSSPWLAPVIAVAKTRIFGCETLSFLCLVRRTDSTDLIMVDSIECWTSLSELYIVTLCFKSWHVIGFYYIKYLLCFILQWLGSKPILNIRLVHEALLGKAPVT